MAAATEGLAWVSCGHSDPPARYRDTPAYYCTYCSYTVCAACFASIPAPLEAAQQRQQMGETAAFIPRQRRQRRDAEADTRAGNGGGPGASDVLTPTKQRAEQADEAAPEDNTCRVPGSMNWLDDVLRLPPITVPRRREGESVRTTGATTATTAASHAGHVPPSHTHRRLSTSSAPLPPPLSSSTTATTATTHITSSGLNSDVPRGDPQRSLHSPRMLCHLCRRGHLVREEALLHEWACEGPAPADRLHRGHALLYDTDNLQKYYFMRAQREARLTSTAPLHAQVLSVSPAVLQSDANTGTETDDHDHVHQQQQQQQGTSSAPPLPLRQTRVRAGASRTKPTPTPSATAAARAAVVSAVGPRDGLPSRSTRRTAAAQAIAPNATAEGGRSRHLRDNGSITSAASVASSSLGRYACEEGGSFVFAVRNPRLAVPLVWCAVNGEPREESPAYARSTAAAAGAALAPANHHTPLSSLSSCASSCLSSITPLLVWSCPPSLPGLPARSYRVGVPYGLYAFANVHALALYAAGDIFRKATAQLVDAALTSSHLHSSGAAEGLVGASAALLLAGLGGPAPHLASATVAPAASLRPLLTVTVLHRVATTPRPLLFTSRLLCSTAVAAVATEKDGETGRARKRPRTPDTAGGVHITKVEDAPGVARPRFATQPAAAPPPGGEGEEVEVEVGEEAEKGDPVQAESQLQWPDGLSSPELALVVDHLLHGRSVAVYGIASKFFFLQHVSSSAELASFHVLTVDASLGRASVPRQSGASGINHSSSGGANGGSVNGGLRQGFQPNSGAAGFSSASSSVMRQLLSVGHALVRRVSSSSTVLTAEMRAEMTATAATAAAAAERHAAQTTREETQSGKNRKRRAGAPHHTSFSLDGGSGAEDGVGGGKADWRGGGAAAARGPVARALLDSDAGRSPAMARDVTGAVLHAASSATSAQPQQHGRVIAVEVVSVDSSAAASTTAASSVCSTSEEDEADNGAKRCSGGVTPARGTVREVLPLSLRTPPSATHYGSSPVDKRSPHAHPLFGGTPLSQRMSADPSGGWSGRRGTTQLGPSSQTSAFSATSPPAMSPIPAFFAALQRTINGDCSHSNRDEDPHEPPGENTAGHEVTCEELPEFFGGLNCLRLPPRDHDATQNTKGNLSGNKRPSATTGGGVAAEMSWRPPVVAYANDAVRKHVLQALRRQHCGRRCVQWASLPSTSAATQLDEQYRSVEDKNGVVSSSPSFPHTLLTRAHQTRPGWLPPVLLVLHNVDLLDSDEVSVLLRLCTQFAFPQPHLQLLVSFDDPLWPLGSAAAALERLGVCTVQLRSLLLPRVHEMRHTNSIHVLTEFEAAAGGGSGGGGGRGGAKGVFRSSSSAGSAATTASATAASAAATVGNSYLLQDTMRRVLFSLPPAFNSLLRILLDVQDEVGEGVFVSLFTVTERFERSGVMVSQGRLKALLRELTSNRIARYDSAEHALMVPQVGRLRKVLNEVTAQRDGGGGGSAAL
ncbi:hypothetical protein ABB37_09652 [Leptomonas pyrrhocoris]|uniref:Uncharacterized protein n=1 Tax=Leptomonas pyrrhocoris TaxID=157538 RepID=A0A0M9FQE6_LEPPY|nr:hypothetical protein ABB37_09652 [Leptomonas pyrrhocoris]XP_015652196.1 hypothetical protein ABB37_09652 [Leptomonas pyrrhocoris]KPA73756.1 hypothetical protein ABB37_09652 [Leptomonas pyrrhocoris]KPA73757.1 hypothetical protein ABB37_09652 [Leptomonas pyrrhocoris]|eukprot:XP_015652195.1 hypothetical protein ABB37_09652 [Leptomonas pyrrhocoris]